LTNLIHEYHQREWYIQGLLLLTKIPLTLQKTTIVVNALEQETHIEAMEIYLGSLIVVGVTWNYEFAQF